MSDIVKKSYDVILDADYAQWIAELAKRYRTSQIKASIKVNDEMLRFYWSVGEDIEKRQFENLYGARFYENVSKDLKHALGLIEGLSPTTIKYTHYFYQLYSPLFANRQQGVDESVPVNHQQEVHRPALLYYPVAQILCHRSEDYRVRRPRLGTASRICGDGR